ncbi:MAG: hypothetical protein R2818_06680 [Flavobacteriales bacterium]
MKNVLLPYSALLTIVILFGSCATVQPTAQVHDDVYSLPPMSPVLAMVGSSAPEVVTEQPSDAYYDPGVAEAMSAKQDFYDVTYNDPYYYNYDRFGFGTSLAYNTGYGWGPNGMRIGFGYGTGVYSGWLHGMIGGPIYPYGTWRYNATFGYYNCFGGPSPWCGPCNGFGSGFGYGYGYGNYYSPYGNCSSCYSPVIIGAGSNVVVGHRPSMGSGTGASRNPGYTRLTVRDPVRLAPSPTDRSGRTVGTNGNITRSSATQRVRDLDPAGTGRQSTSSRPIGNTTTRGTRSVERNSNTRSGSSGEMRSTSPSRSPSGNGGSRSGGGSTGGGGSRTISPTRR